jgi:hypothetical protein
VIDADQTGNVDYNTAPEQQQTFTVAAATQSITFTSTAPTNATVNGQYTPAATASSGLNVTFAIDSATTNSACSLTSGIVSFDHAGTCVIDANQTGSGDYTPATEQQQTFVIAGVPQSITSTIPTPTTTTATVAVTTTSPPSPAVPQITARLSSRHPKSRFGWYRSPVTVTFTCTTNGATLTGRCPKPITLSRNAAHQSVTRTITTTAGKTAMVSIGHINIDGTKPIITIRGVDTAVTDTTAPHAACSATDPLSGIASCTLSTHSTPPSGNLDIRTTTYTATATTRAGVTVTKTITARVLGINLTGSRFAHGVFHTHPGASYTITVTATRQPHYFYTAPFAAAPSGGGKAFAHTGANTWTFRVHLVPNLFDSFKTWVLGIQINGTLHRIPITGPKVR